MQNVEWHEVIPETVGQFTGLTDKNGTKIFEGDIVDCWSEFRRSKKQRKRGKGMKIVNNGLTTVIDGALGHFPKEFVVSALEKQIPKKPKTNDDGWFCCRNCGETFSLTNTLHKRNKYCGECGQALDWSDTK